MRYKLAALIYRFYPDERSFLVLLRNAREIEITPLNCAARMVKRKSLCPLTHQKLKTHKRRKLPALAGSFHS